MGNPVKSNVSVVPAVRGPGVAPVCPLLSSSTPVGVTQHGVAYNTHLVACVGAACALWVPTPAHPSGAEREVKGVDDYPGSPAFGRCGLRQGDAR